MDDEKLIGKDTLLYWLFLAFGVILILISFSLRAINQDSVWVDLLTNGASLIENTTEIGRITVERAICRSENAYFYG